METIEIANGVVKLVEREVVKSITLRAFKESILATMGFQTPLLPPGTVLYGHKEQKSLYVLEQPPAKRTIKHKKEARRNGAPMEYAIPLPWVYFLAQFNNYALEDLLVFFRPERLMKVEEDLYYPALPNCFADCRVCLGDYRFDVTSSIPARVTSVMTFFWDSIFNLEASDLYLRKMPKEIKDLTQPGEEHFAGWERLPEGHACRASWAKYGPLDEVVKEILGKEENA
jgi:hypothetical protein